MKEKMNGMNKESLKKVYLDFNATTPVAPTVAEKVTETLLTAWGNPSSSYPSGRSAKSVIEEARLQICDMINGNHVDEVIFMSGGTEANNNIISSSIEYFKEQQNKSVFDISDKPHIISSEIEHDSILRVLQHYEKKGLIDVTYVPISHDIGCISVESIMKEIRKTTILATIMLANNETGAIQPIGEIGRDLTALNMERCSKHGLTPILFHTDAAQAIGKINVDVNKLHVDFLTIVGHKFYGPRIGALWVRSGCPFYPMMHGGGQENNRRSGTENTCMIAGLGEAARMVTKHLNDYHSHFQKIKNYLKTQLISLFGEDRIAFNQYTDDILPNTVNVSIIGNQFSSSEILSLCKILQASKGAACHTGSGNKPSPILLAQGVPLEHAKNAIRLSVGRETTVDEIDRATHDLFKAACSINASVFNTERKEGPNVLASMNKLSNGFL